MRKSTRFRFTFFSAVFLAVISLVATIYKQETIAVTAITGIMTILSTYIWSQTKRPHND